MSTLRLTNAGVDFRIRISPRIRIQNRNCLEGSVRDLGQSDLCKTSKKLVHCHVPLTTSLTSSSQIIKESRNHTVLPEKCTKKLMYPVIFQGLRKMQYRYCSLRDKDPYPDNGFVITMEVKISHLYFNLFSNFNLFTSLRYRYHLRKKNSSTAC